jgi:hypothetical protein
VGFDNLLKRHNKTWRVRRVNLCLDQAMMGHDVTHVGIIDVATFVRDDTWRAPKFSRQEEADASDC